jgi:hypothetical protein
MLLSETDARKTLRQPYIGVLMSIAHARSSLIVFASTTEISKACARFWVMHANPALLCNRHIDVPDTFAIAFTVALISLKESNIFESVCQINVNKLMLGGSSFPAILPVVMACSTNIRDASGRQPENYSHSSGEFQFYEQSITHE